MNITEGMRRLALAVGVFGACSGALVSYIQLQTLLRQRAQHEADSIVAKYGGKPAIPSPFVPPPLSSHQGPSDKIGSADREMTDLSKYGTISQTEQRMPAPPIDYNALADQARASVNALDALPPPVARYNVLTDAPALSAYLLLFAFPVFGFLLPWSVIRAVSWVVNGFSNSGT